MPRVYFIGGPMHGKYQDLQNAHSGSYWHVAVEFEKFSYRIDQFYAWGEKVLIGYVGPTPYVFNVAAVAEQFNWFPVPQSQKPKAKASEKPCLKCKAMRAFKYDLKKDWFQCTICLYCYSPETLAQVKDNFTFPGTAAFLKSFFPFPVDSSYPSQYKAQIDQFAYQQQKKMYQEKLYKQLHEEMELNKLKKSKPPVPGYRELASIEFEGVEELDPSLWGDADSTGLL